MISAHVVTLSDQIELSQAKLAAATETLRVTNERKQHGVGIVLEDLQAERDLERARADYLSSIAEQGRIPTGQSCWLVGAGRSLPGLTTIRCLCTLR